MATTNESPGTITEECESCARQTPHEVTVTLLTESDHAENAEFSREPYRVSVCQACGEQTERRMNNA